MVLDFNLPKFLVVFIEVLCVWIVNKVIVMHSRARISTTVENTEAVVKPFIIIIIIKYGMSNT